MKTWLTERLGIKYPVIQGAMQGLATAELAAAVSNAGGLGIIAAGSYASAGDFGEDLRKLKSLTDKPFGANFSLLPTRREITWEYYIYTALEEGISIIETSGRSPEPYMEWLSSSGATLLHKAPRLRDALSAEGAGVHAVTVYGAEAGGHLGPDEVSTFTLVPGAVDALQIPVIAAGGFANGQGLAAALGMGAAGIMMGTRFLASLECPLHPNLKAAVLAATENDTVIIERSLGAPARVLRTGFAEKVLEMEAAGAAPDELFPYLSSARTQANYLTGDPEGALIYCGQAAGLINEIVSVKDIIDGIIAGAEEVTGRL